MIKERLAVFFINCTLARILHCRRVGSKRNVLLVRTETTKLPRSVHLTVKFSSTIGIDVGRGRVY